MGKGSLCQPLAAMSPWTAVNAALLLALTGYNYSVFFSYTGDNAQARPDFVVSMRKQAWTLLAVTSVGTAEALCVPGRQTETSPGWFLLAGVAAQGMAMLGGYVLYNTLHGIDSLQGVYGETGGEFSSEDALSFEHVAYWAHVIGAALISGLGLLQFVPAERKWLAGAFHRYLGRGLLLSGLVGMAGAVMLLLVEFGLSNKFGMEPTSPDSLAATFVTFVGAVAAVICIVKGYITARRRDFAAHGRWMYRMAAVMLAFGFMARPVLFTYIDLLTRWLGFEFSTSFWLGALICLLQPQILLELCLRLGVGPFGALGYGGYGAEAKQQRAPLLLGAE